MKTIFSALVMILTLCGCRENRTVVVSGKVPTLEAAEKPVLEKLTPEEITSYLSTSEEARRKIEGNTKKLMSYAEQNAAVIEKYNNFAEFRNASSDEFLGIEKKEKK